jgi:hypothetical protein
VETTVENETQTLTRPFKMRANRKVIEGQCSICGKEFVLTEDVYACPFCSGHHHAACWEAQQACPRAASTVTVALPTEDVAEDDASSSQPPVKPELASDERRCPSCTKVIKRAAMKCRFCGKILDRAFGAQTSAEDMPSTLAQEAESSANRSMIMGLISVALSLFLVSIWLFILALAAISKGLHARRLLNQYPQYASGTIAGGKANAGIVMGVLSILLGIIVFFSLPHK